MNSETIRKCEDIVRSFVPNPHAKQHDIDDIVQDVMLEIVMDPRSILAAGTRNPESDTPTLERRRLRNLIIKVIRRKPHPPTPPSWCWPPSPSELAKKVMNIPHPGKAVDEEVEEDEIRCHLNQAAMRLREPFRSAVMLHFFENVPLEKTAGRLGFPVERIHVLIETGLNLLRDDLNLSAN